MSRRERLPALREVRMSVKTVAMRSEHEVLALELLPKLLPPSWKRAPELPPGHPLRGLINFLHPTGLSVVFSVGEHDGKRWLHVSVTARNRCPFWAEMCDVKDLFIGRDRQAVQVMPPRSEWISIHPYCLHLWACLDAEGDGLPKFGRHGTI